MNLFRSLVMATAVFCSFGTIAGVMTFNPTDSAALRIVISNNPLDPWEQQVSNSTIKLNATQSQVQLGQLNLLYDRGVAEDENPDSYSRFLMFNGEIDYLSDQVQLQYLTELAGVSQYIGPLVTYKNSVNIRMFRSPTGSATFLFFKFSYWETVLAGYEGVGKTTEITFDQQILFRNRQAQTSWMQGLEIPTESELLAWLSKTNTAATLSSTLSIQTYTCDLSTPGCRGSHTGTSAWYYLEQEGALQWQNETVNAPATITVFVLGLAGLALRRRLTA